MVNDFTEMDFFRDQRLVEDPYPYYEALRTRCPVTREGHYGVTMVTGWDEACAVLNNAETFSSCISVTGPFPGFPVPLEGDDVTGLIEEHRDELPFSDRPRSGHARVHVRVRAGSFGSRPLRGAAVRGHAGGPRGPAAAVDLAVSGSSSGLGHRAVRVVVRVSGLPAGDTGDPADQRERAGSRRDPGPRCAPAPGAIAACPLTGSGTDVLLPLVLRGLPDRPAALRLVLRPAPGTVDRNALDNLAWVPLTR